MRYVCLLCVLTVAAGCGGGGVAAPNPVNPNAALAQAVLESCAEGNIDQLVRILGILQGLTDPGAALPAINVTLIDGPGMTIAWDLDVNNDMLPDLMGTIGLGDGVGGLPAVDFSPVENQGLPGLPQVLATMPDDAVANLDFNGDDQQGTLTLGTFIVTYQNNLPDTASGQIDVQAACIGSTMLDATAVAGIFTGGVPNTGFAVDFSTNDGTVGGTMTFNGSDTARFDIMFDGDSFSFAYDITLMTVTELP